MTRYVWKDGHFRDRKTGEPMPVPERDGICTPMVISDIPEYASPIDGRIISSRSSRREDMKRNDCIPWEPGIGTKGKTFRFPDKRG